MKTFKLPLLFLTTLVFIGATGFSFEQDRTMPCHFNFDEESIEIAGGKILYSKSVWSTIEIDQKINAVVFGPLNKDMPGFSRDYRNWGIKLESFETHKASINWNLWTVISYSFYKGGLTIYSPRNPEWVDTWDNGHLEYPVTAEKYGNSPEGTFFTDDDFNAFVREGFLGQTDFSSPLVVIQSQEYPGEDSIDANGNSVYYPREYIWYEDKDVVGYRIKEKWVTNANGEVQDKIIEAICPLANAIDWRSGEIVGTNELFWIDYNQLKPLLLDYYVLLDRYRTERIISYQDYFEERQFYAEVDTSMAVKVTKE